MSFFATDTITSIRGAVEFYQGAVATMRKLKAFPLGIESAKSAFELLRTSPHFLVEQKEVEFFSLLERITDKPPKYLCEIGARNGGTLFLFTRVCRPDAVLISIDLLTTAKRAAIHSRLGAAAQRIKCIRGNSRALGVIERVKSILNGNKLDFLFIDGDHSYDGVKSDFLNYAPLVAPGGVIAFHDIVADFKTRYGVETPCYSGGVPSFWEEIKKQYPDQTEEWIESSEQDAYGIGILCR